MGYRVVVVGATGNVGKEMLNILAEREFPVDAIAALASRRSSGTHLAQQGVVAAILSTRHECQHPVRRHVCMYGIPARSRVREAKNAKRAKPL